MIDLPFRGEIRCDLHNCGCRFGSLIWVSHEKKAVYFEIPKTGCSSIKHAFGIDPRLEKPIPGNRQFQPSTSAHDIAHKLFGKRRGGQWIAALKGEVNAQYSNQAPPALGVILSATIEKLAGELEGNRKVFEDTWRPHATSPFGFAMHYGTAASAVELYPDYYKFAVVWEPYRRLVSSWSMFCLSGQAFRRHQLDELFADDTSEYDFSAFLNQALKTRNHHWESCVAFLPANVACTRHLDAVISLSKLNATWPSLVNTLGIDVPLPHLNRSGKGRSRPELAPTDRRLIESEYADDLRLLESIDQ